MIVVLLVHLTYNANRKHTIKICLNILGKEWVLLRSEKAWIKSFDVELCKILRFARLFF